MTHGALTRGNWLRRAVPAAVLVFAAVCLLGVLRDAIVELGLSSQPPSSRASDQDRPDQEPIRSDVMTKDLITAPLTDEQQQVDPPSSSVSRQPAAADAPALEPKAIESLLSALEVWNATGVGEPPDSIELLGVSSLCSQIPLLLHPDVRIKPGYLARKDYNDYLTELGRTACSTTEIYDRLSHELMRTLGKVEGQEPPSTDLALANRLLWGEEPLTDEGAALAIDLIERTDDLQAMRLAINALAVDRRGGVDYRWTRLNRFFSELPDIANMNESWQTRFTDLTGIIAICRMRPSVCAPGGYLTVNLCISVTQRCSPSYSVETYLIDMYSMRHIRAAEVAADRIIQGRIARRGRP